jgi:hypothetical protein
MKSGITGGFLKESIIQTVIETNTTNHQNHSTLYWRYSPNNDWDASSSTPSMAFVKKSSYSTFLITLTMNTVWYGSWNYSAQEGMLYRIRDSINSDMSSPNSYVIGETQWDTRGGDNPTSQFAQGEGGVYKMSTYLSTTAGTTIYFQIQKAPFGPSVSSGATGRQCILKVEEIQA